MSTNTNEAELLGPTSEKVEATSPALHSTAAHDDDNEDTTDTNPPRDWRFWMVFISILLCVFIAAVDLVSRERDSLCTNGGVSPGADSRTRPDLLAFLFSCQTAISTAAPVIVHDLNGVEFTWMYVQLLRLVARVSLSPARDGRPVAQAHTRGPPRLRLTSSIPFPWLTVS
jgi:hypothetical protein